MAGTQGSPLPADTSKTEPKVTVSAVVQYVVGVVLVAVVSAAQDGQLVSFLPDWAAAVLAPVLPVALAWAAAYRTRHQFRTPETVAGA